MKKLYKNDVLKQRLFHFIFYNHCQCASGVLLEKTETAKGNLGGIGVWVKYKKKDIFRCPYFFVIRLKVPFLLRLFCSAHALIGFGLEKQKITPKTPFTKIVFDEPVFQSDLEWRRSRDLNPGYDSLVLLP